MMLRRVVLAALVLDHAHAFAFHAASSSSSRYYTASRYWSQQAIATNNNGDENRRDDANLWQELRSMKPRQLKEELSSLMISTNDIFEKEQLIQRLYDARKSKPSTTTATSNEPPVTTSPTTSSSSDAKVTVVAAALFLTSDRKIRRHDSVNGDTIAIQERELHFPFVDVEVSQPGVPNFPLCLLVDTACSCVMLRPKAARNMPKIHADWPKSIGAGGIQEAAGLTQIHSLRLGGDSFGPVPSFVQDLNILPPHVDGILGLSFLRHFACVEMDFRQGQLRLYETERQPPAPHDLRVVADANMMLLGDLGVYAVDACVGDLGPVRLLVDSGATSTFLNWKGLSDLSLSKDSYQVRCFPTSANMGAMGSDNVTIKLTHRYFVRDDNILHLGRTCHGPYSGIPLDNEADTHDKKKFYMDIAEIGVLDLMKDYQVGGILGVDVLSMCSMVRMNFSSGRAPRITCFNELL